MCRNIDENYNDRCSLVWVIASKRDSRNTSARNCLLFQSIFLRSSRVLTIFPLTSGFILQEQSNLVLGARSLVRIRTLVIRA